MSRLCFVEFEDEFRALESRFGDDPELILVPLTERVRRIACSRNRTSITVDDLLTDRTHLRVLSAVQEWESRVSSIVSAAGGGHSASVSFLGHVRFLLQYVLLLTDLVLTASLRYPQATLVAAKVPFVPSGSGEISFGNQRVLGPIVETVADALHRPSEVIHLRSSESQTLRSMGPFTGTILSALNQILVSILARQRVVVVPSLAYGMPHLIAAIQRQGASVVLCRDGWKEGLRCVGGAGWSILALLLGWKSGGNALKGVAGVLSVPLPRTTRCGKWWGVAERVLQDPCVYRGVPLAQVLKEKVVIDIVDVSERTELLTVEYQRLFTKLRPATILSQMARWGNGAALGEAGAREGVPSVLISHGSHVAPRTRVETMAVEDHATGLLHSPVFRFSAVQCPAAEQTLRQVSPLTRYIRCRPVMWGYRAIREKQQPLGVEPVILHAGTAKPRWAWRPWWYETTEEYISGLTDIIKAVDRLKCGRLIVRYRPFPECSLEDLKARLPVSDRVTIKTDGAFLEDLTAADLLMSFSSTTLEEALHARKPVLQYGGGGRYRHLPGLLWGEGPPRRSAVYSVSEACDLEPALSWILDQHAGAPLSDEELKGYVFGEGEALSPDQLAEALVNPDLLRPWIKTTATQTPLIQEPDPVSVC